MFKIQIYTDGACSGNPGAGGWAAILTYGLKKKEINGYEPETTNNRMELTAVIEGLKRVKFKSEIAIFCDSAYVINAFEQKWIDKWQENAWTSSSKKEVQNRDLWEQLLSLISFHQVTFHKVKGHSDDLLNNRCDELARAAIKNKGATTNAEQ